MNSVTKRLTTNTRIIKEHFNKYGDTFKAFKELINNSIQAGSKKISIDIEYVEDLSFKSGIKNITIRDNGVGVAHSDFEKKILEVGTTVKENGFGIGRFSSFQLGELMHIETVAYDSQLKQYTKTTLSLDTLDIADAQFENTELTVGFEELGEAKQTPYYQVKIERLHHNINEKTIAKNQLSKKFLKDNINDAIFESYPFELFNGSVKFSVNEYELKREDFVLGNPTKNKLQYTDKKGTEHSLDFFFYNVKVSLNKVKVFFQVENAGLKSIVHEFTYSSDFQSPDLGTWFIYIDFSHLDTDLFRNLDLEGLGEAEVKNLKGAIRDHINEFFKPKNRKYEKFVTSLEADAFYPYNTRHAASTSQEVIFKKVAYLIEKEHHILGNEEKIRTFLYPLLDRAISDGNVKYVFEQVLKLSEDGLEKFKGLLKRTDMEDVIHFASLVAEKTEFLDFLHEIVYGDISKHIKERSQLHKIVEEQLWLFGENYNNTPRLWSDKKLGNIISELNEKQLVSEPSTEDENLIEISDEGLNDITDLFFLNEKSTDSGDREIMIVELKAPKCAISEKELKQIDKYAFTIEENAAFPSDGVRYKLILISSKLTRFAKSKMKSAQKAYPDKPFLYEIKSEKNIEIYVMTWSELIQFNRKKMSYLANQLAVKEKSVSEKFEEEYSELIDDKVASRLTLVK